MRYILTILLLLFGLTLFAQKKNGQIAVYLNNGSVIIGELVEQTEEGIKVLISGGSVFYFPMNDVGRIESAEPFLMKHRTPDYYKDKGFVSYNSLSFLIGSADFYVPVGLEFASSNGYKFNRYFAGTLTLGTFFLNEYMGTSLGIRGTSDLFRGNGLVHFAAGECGWGIPWGTYNNDWEHHDGGPYLRVISGVNILTKNRLSFSLFTGYTHRRDRSTIRSNWPVDNVRERTVRFNRLELGLSLNF